MADVRTKPLFSDDGTERPVPVVDFTLLVRPKLTFDIHNRGAVNGFHGGDMETKGGGFHIQKRHFVQPNGVGSTG